MATTLRLVSDRRAERPEPGARPAPDGGGIGSRARGAARAAWPRRPGLGARGGRLAAAARDLAGDERGAVTAEYAIVIMAAVAFAGLLVAIMRSKEIREMLVRLVENALAAGG